jgi:hypothetical protein
MIRAPRAAASRIIASALSTFSGGSIELRIWTKPSLSMAFTRVDQLAAQSANCKFFSSQFSLGLAAVAAEGKSKC